MHRIPTDNKLIIAVRAGRLLSLGRARPPGVKLGNSQADATAGL
jgi:hypothetical protein